MKIGELIKILETSDNKNMDIYIPIIENDKTTNIGYSFDDLGNIELYEVSEKLS